MPLFRHEVTFREEATKTYYGTRIRLEDGFFWFEEEVETEGIFGPKRKAYVRGVASAAEVVGIRVTTPTPVKQEKPIDSNPD